MKIIPTTFKLLSVILTATTFISDTIRTINFSTMINNYLNGVDSNKKSTEAPLENHPDIKQAIDITGSYTVNRIIDSAKTLVNVKLSADPYGFKDVVGPVGTVTSLIAETIEGVIRKDSNEKAKLVDIYIKNEAVIQNIIKTHPSYATFDDPEHKFTAVHVHGQIVAEKENLPATLAYFLGMYVVEFSLLFYFNGIPTMLNGLKLMIPAATIAIAQDEANKATMHKTLAILQNSVNDHPLKTDNLEEMRLSVCRQEIFKDSLDKIKNNTTSVSEFNQIKSAAIADKLAGNGLYQDEYVIIKFLKDNSGGLFSSASSVCSAEDLQALQVIDMYSVEHNAAAYSLDYTNSSCTNEVFAEYHQFACPIISSSVAPCNSIIN